jgi:hypothetical protein
MSSIDISQVPELVDSTAYPVMFEAYAEDTLVYPSLGQIIDPNDVSTPLYGDKGTVIEGMERFKRRQDGEEVKSSTTKTSFTWYGSIGIYSRSITIAKRALDAADASAKVPSLLSQFGKGWGMVARLQKEDHVADLFQKGTLTAGDATLFDGSHPNNEDPNKGFIYDGLPWFDTAHTLTGSSTTLSNHTASLELTQANVQTVLTTMTSTNAVNERGERIAMNPNVLMVPPGLEYRARVILGTTQVSGSANNDINPIAGRLGLIVNRALDDSASSAAWWVGERNAGLRIYDSGAPVIRIVMEKNGDVTVVAEYYFGANVDNWRPWYCANKAAS